MSLRRWKYALAVVVLAIAGYAAVRMTLHFHWVTLTHGRRDVDIGVAPEVNDPTKVLSIFLIGDAGMDSHRRQSVIESMRRLAVTARPDCVLMAGDNFYGDGVHSVDDPRFQSDFEQVYSREEFDCPFYVCLGNHDYNGNTDAQVEYAARSRRWKMPANYYAFRQSAGRASVDFFVIDTMPICMGEDSAGAQIAWLERQLAASDARWKVVMGHHPAISGGVHGSSAEIGSSVAPLFEKYGVNLYLSGHDHDLQVNDSGQGWLQVVSGAGSKLRSTWWTDKTLYANSTPGFCWLLFSEEEAAISIYSADERLFTHVLRLPHAALEADDAALPDVQGIDDLPTQH